MARSLAALLLIACASEPPQLRAGAKIEQVTPFGPAAIAGLLPGDLVVGWDRGSVTTPFDLLELEMVEVPRGPITLTVYRDAKQRLIPLPIGEWRTTARSALTGDLERLDVDARRLFADSKFLEAAAAFERLATGLSDGKRDRDACWSLIQLGIAQSRAHLAADSDRSFQRARDIARSLPDPATEGHILNAFAEELTARNESRKSDQALRDAIQVRQNLDPDGLAVAAYQCRLGNQLRNRGDFKGAEDTLRQAIAIRERLAPGSIELATAWSALASSLSTRGDDRTAEPLYRRALKLREAFVPMGADLRSQLGNLGIIMKNQGDLSGAEEQYRKSLQLAERADPTGPDVGYPLSYLGNLARLKGERAQAEGYYLRALAIFQKHRPASVDVAGCFNNLGRNAAEQGDVAGAEAFHRQALALREKLVPDSLDVAASLSALANLAKDRGDLVAAEPLLQRSLALKTRFAPDTLIVSTTLYAQGDLEVAKGNLQKSLELHLAALAIRTRLAPGTADEARSLHAVGGIQRLLGDSKAAAAAWATAIEIVEAQRGRLKDSEDARSGFASGFAELFRDQLDLLVEAKRAPEAFNLLERSRAHGFLAMLAQRPLELSSNLMVEQRELDSTYDKAQAALGKLNPVKDAAELQTGRAALIELAAQRGKLTARIRETAPQVAAFSQPQSFDLTQAQGALEPGTAVLAYSVGHARTLLFVVTAERLEVFVLPLTAQSLRARVATFRGLIERGRSLPQLEPALLAQAERLFADLLGPATSILDGQQRLLISPDGPLHVLPFAALVRNRAPLEYLAEWKPVNSIVSVTVYAQLRARRRSPPPPSTLVAFGDPSSAGNFAQLKATRDEVTGIAALFADASKVFLGGEATETRALAAGASARYLHFATHGILDRRLPLDSALVLTPSNTDNGLLQAWEIIEKLRIDADLVTLSGCETGLGRELGGEGIIGLSRAFQFAGARSVVVSLWSVEDRSTAILMKAFYAQLKEGKSKNAALAWAQRTLIHSDGFAQQPFHWAAFELTGDWM